MSLAEAPEIVILTPNIVVVPFLSNEPVTSPAAITGKAVVMKFFIAVIIVASAQVTSRTSEIYAELVGAKRVTLVTGVIPFLIAATNLLSGLS